MHALACMKLGGSEACFPGKLDVWRGYLSQVEGTNAYIHIISSTQCSAVDHISEHPSKIKLKLK